MENFTIVRGEHLNHYGHLFGGQMLSWVDEYSWLAASRDFPNCLFVTRAMDNIEFKTGALNGSIIRFDINMTKTDKTSVVYSVEVYAEAPGKKEEVHVFRTNVTFVNIDENGKKASIK